MLSLQEDQGEWKQKNKIKSFKAAHSTAQRMTQSSEMQSKPKKRRKRKE
jgi:hypothetical protein